MKNKKFRPAFETFRREMKRLGFTDEQINSEINHIVSHEIEERRLHLLDMLTDTVGEMTNKELSDLQTATGEQPETQEGGEA